jgi:Na+-transporting NADH:ubiquinone oxidoreductase subunit A
MSKFVKLKKGFDIKLVGKAEKKISDLVQPETFAIKPADFVGMQRPKVVVKEGDIVKAGTPILFDKKMEQVLYTAPVSGEVVEIVRGDRRKLLEIKILADKTVEYEQFPKTNSSGLASITRKDAQEVMTKSGVWPQIIQRPFGIIANPEDTPKSIFISAFDTHPLAPDYDFMFKGEEQYFQAGVSILRKFTNGKIHLNINVANDASSFFNQVTDVVINKISGPHPAGNVGVQIHHIDPINKGDLVWTLNPYGVIQIGKLFLEGRYDASKVISVNGSEVSNPQYYRTYLGACIAPFLKGNLKNDHVRVISGNVLTGTKIAREGYIGYYDHMLSVIPEGDYHEMFGWILPTTKKLSFHRAFGLLSFANKDKEYVLDTNTRGEERAFVQTGVFEKVVPMDILPVYLLKSIMAEDFEGMESLGIYELIEEDLALCEFIDVSKHNVQEILREGIDLILNS